MRAVLLTLAAACLAACGADELTQVQKETREQNAVDLFAQTCAAFDGDAARISAWANANRAAELSAEERKNLPFGMIELDAQKVWQIQRDDAQYYLSIAPESCSVKTEKADEERVRRAFIELVQQQKGSRAVELRADNAAQTPFPFRQLAYAWRANGSPKEIVLTANTSPSDQLPAQAALSLTHQNYATVLP